MMHTETETEQQQQQQQRRHDARARASLVPAAQLVLSEPEGLMLSVIFSFCGVHSYLQLASVCKLWLKVYLSEATGGQRDTATAPSCSLSVCCDMR